MTEMTNIRNLIDEIDRRKLSIPKSNLDEELEGLRFVRDGTGGFEVDIEFYTGQRGVDADLMRIQSILDYYRRKKERRYREHLSGGYLGLKCVAEGDSWCELPPIGYSSDIVLELWNEFAVLSLAKAGDAWSNVIRQDELFSTIATEQSDVAILSVGGNNVLGSIERFVHHWSTDRPVDNYVNDEFEYELNKATYYTDLWVTKITSMGCNVIMHGYGHCDPRTDREGGWLIGGPLSNKRNINDRRIWQAVVSELVDRFNQRISRLAAQPKFQGKFRFLDLTKSLGKGPLWWEDEVHPTKKGFSMIADVFRGELNNIATERSGS
ncbi:SGNH/GDSL hydrolase family protein [Roseibium polysiphoniae]|nr:SGNH/GDSL hydrolase family protein [Roseibium polysiphoniae]